MSLSSRKGTFLGLVTVVGLATVFVLISITAPFGRAGLVTETAIYCELFAQCWDEAGFVPSLGIPMLSPVGQTVAERQPYVHHPPVGWWPPYFGRMLLGKGNEGYRIFPALFTAFSAVMAFFLVRRTLSWAWALVGAALFLTAPLISLYGAMPNMEPFTLATSMVVVALWQRFRTQPDRRRLVVLFVGFVMGCQVEWAFYFLCPGIWAAELLQGRGGRNLKTGWLFPLGVLGFLLVCLHMSLGIGSLAHVFEEVKGAALSAATEGSKQTVFWSDKAVHFISNQGKHLANNVGSLGGPVTLLILVVLLARRRWRRDPVTGMGVAFLVQALCVVVVFNGRTITHGYYWFPVAMAYALLLLQGIRMAAEILRGRLPPAAAYALPVILAALMSLHGLSHARTLKNANEAPGLEEYAHLADQFFGVDQWVCCNDPTHLGAMLYSRRRWTPPIVWPDKIELILEARKRGEIPMTQLVVVIGASTRERFPEFCAWLEVLVRERRATSSSQGDNALYFL